MKIDFVVKDNYWFNPPKVYQEGVGGAEYILIFLAKALAALDHDVTIYNDCHVPANYDGVEYRLLNQYEMAEHRDVLVAWRVSYHGGINADKFVFFSTDQYTDREWEGMFPRLDRFFCISPYHLEYVAQHYKIDREKLVVVTPAVNYPDYHQKLEKKRYKMIFCSVPDRGLAQLMEAWPIIKRRIPQATLVITSDYTLWGANPNNHRYLGLTQLPGIEYLGKVPRKLLVEHQLTSEIMAYPLIYDENFCVAAAECMAAGAVPVVMNVGCIATTVRDGGIVLNGSALKFDGLEAFIEAVCSLIEDQEKMNGYRARGYDIAANEYTFEAMAARFIEAL